MSLRSLHPALVAAIVTAGFAVMPIALQAQAAADNPATAAAVIEIVAEDYALDAPDVIPSGWTTIEFENVGEEQHMVFMGRLPEGVSFEQYQTEGQERFNQIWIAIQEGRADFDRAMEMLGEVLPEWFPELRFPGGPGLLAPGLESNVTLLLEPGDYAIECYVKAEDGSVHYMEGMTRPLTVTEERSDATQPSPDIRVTLSNGGMDLAGDLTPGRHIVEVHVLENPEAGFGHSVHFARLDAETTADEVVAWMNWFGMDGMRAPAPADFVGGMHPMGAGDTAYFSVDLEPGRYLALSEATAHQGVLLEFRVR